MVRALGHALAANDASAGDDVSAAVRGLVAAVRRARLTVVTRRARADAGGAAVARAERDVGASNAGASRDAAAGWARAASATRSVPAARAAARSVAGAHRARARRADGPDQLVVNVGDMLERLTNKKLKSTIHRVVNPPRSLMHLPRYSIPFFMHPEK